MVRTAAFLACLSAWACGSEAEEGLRVSPGEERGAPVSEPPSGSAAEPGAGVAPALECDEPGPPYDFQCDGSEDHCAICFFGHCLGAERMSERFARCDDGVCDPCEPPCAADCAEPPVLAGDGKNLDPAHTLFVEVRGFTFERYEDFPDTVYGAVSSGSRLSETVRELTGRPDGRIFPFEPNQVVEVEYYGGVPADWMSSEDVADIERFPYASALALQRYALIVAKFLRYRVESTGAEHVGVFCHSMGCHLTRYLIENDLEGLASDQLISRWVTNAGVLAGARLAQLYDNPTVREVGNDIGINTYDFVHMHPDYVQEVSASWDHDIYAADNPLFRGVYVHHLAAAKEELTESIGLPLSLLALDNPDREPNDGIVFVADMHFHRQELANRVQALGGERLLPSTSYLFIDHLAVGRAREAGLVMAAGLTGDRQVTVRLKQLRLLDDLEGEGSWDLDDLGVSPAELVAESRIDYEGLVFHETRLADRTREPHIVEEGELYVADEVLFRGPVLPQQDMLSLTVRLLEVDLYRRFGVVENVLNRDRVFIEESLELPIEEGEVALVNDRIEALLTVDIARLY